MEYFVFLFLSLCICVLLVTMNILIYQNVCIWFSLSSLFSLFYWNTILKKSNSFVWFFVVIVIIWIHISDMFDIWLVWCSLKTNLRLFFPYNIYNLSPIKKTTKQKKSCDGLWQRKKNWIIIIIFKHKKHKIDAMSCYLILKN